METTRPLRGEGDTALFLAAPHHDGRLVRPPRFRVRHWMAALRALPDFVIVGAMKSGTSSLYSYLIKHPQIMPAFRKETHYFTRGKRAGYTENWYRAHFPLKVAKGRRLTGEATAGYSFEPGAIEALSETVPDAKIIMLLRDPVERAISHYFHELRAGRETLPIEEAMAIEDDRQLAALRAGESGRETMIHASYKRRGIYHEQIRRLWRHFPRNQVLVMGSTDVFEAPERAVARVCDFLGVKTMNEQIDYRIANRGTNRKPVPQSVRDELSAFFEPHNRALEELLGKRLDW
ncbi:sulfotransferase [Parvularcula lutaonensis]|uniref:Sulfotransferase n=1 Tax=Parvularcula lutaonensis TaxID=491923 RepID=A0ABV7MDP1_9PROT|nr:sulfotransferase [Parvularcula lutaonensis]GGY40831.1 hypothetical protein GCM10007148_06740 [Parvularcula lutaonensis]